MKNKNVNNINKSHSHYKAQSQDKLHSVGWKKVTP